MTSAVKNNYAVIACVSGALAVIVGSFGAHGLPPELPEKYLHAFEVGVRYQFYHSLALLAFCSFDWNTLRLSTCLWASRLFVLGIILFSGSLYALTLTRMDILGAITPFGGLAFIAAWIAAAFSFRKTKTMSGESS